MAYEHERREQSNYTKPYSAEYPPARTDQWWRAEEYLKSRGLSVATAAGNGWYVSDRAGDERFRLVIPATSENPANKFWQARDLEHGEPRYQSPHGVRRGDALIFVYPAKPIKALAVVEGPMDALAAAEMGYLGVALMGTTPGAEAKVFLAKIAKKWATSGVIVVPDRDQEGSMLRVWQDLGIAAGIGNVYPYKDLAEWWQYQPRASMSIAKP